jgi:hypothetical protein
VVAGLGVLKVVGRWFITRTQHNPAYESFAAAAAAVGLLLFMYFFHQIVLFATALTATSDRGPVIDLTCRTFPLVHPGGDREAGDRDGGDRDGGDREERGPAERGQPDRSPVEESPVEKPPAVAAATAGRAGADYDRTDEVPADTEPDTSLTDAQKE